MEESVESDGFLSTQIQLEVRNYMTKLDNNGTQANTATSTFNRNLCGPLLPCMFFIVAYALSHGIGISSPLIHSHSAVFVRHKATSQQRQFMYGHDSDAVSILLVPLLLIYQEHQSTLIYRTRVGHMLWRAKQNVYHSMHRKTTAHVFGSFGEDLGAEMCHQTIVTPFNLDIFQSERVIRPGTSLMFYHSNFCECRDLELMKRYRLLA